jgi:hypothetical protein
MRILLAGATRAIGRLRPLPWRSNRRHVGLTIRTDRGDAARALTLHIGDLGRVKTLIVFLAGSWTSSFAARADRDRAGALVARAALTFAQLRGQPLVVLPVEPEGHVEAHWSTQIGLLMSPTFAFGALGSQARGDL